MSWQQSANQPMRLHRPVPGLSAQQSLPAPSTEHVLVVAWNFKRDYNIKEFQKDLIEIDFEPDLPETSHGAYLLYYSEGWLANALVMSLDGTQDYFKGHDQPIRLAKWNTVDKSCSACDIPSHIKQAAAAAAAAAVAAAAAAHVEVSVAKDPWQV